MRWRELPLHPPIRTLRCFALYGFLFLSALAIWWWRREDELTALTLGTLAVLIVSLGLIRPQYLRPIFATSLIATFPLGWLVSHALLFFVFYGLFAPLGIFFRLIKRDALALRIRPEYKSYWTEKPPARDARSYFRQS